MMKCQLVCSIALVAMVSGSLRLPAADYETPRQHLEFVQAVKQSLVAGDARRLIRAGTNLICYRHVPTDLADYYRTYGYLSRSLGYSLLVEDWLPSSPDELLHDDTYRLSPSARLRLESAVADLDNAYRRFRVFRRVESPPLSAGQLDELEMLFGKVAGRMAAAYQLLEDSDAALAAFERSIRTSAEKTTQSLYQTYRAAIYLRRGDQAAGKDTLHLAVSLDSGNALAAEMLRNTE